jgi:hypothetical protein
VGCEKISGGRMCMCARCVFWGWVNWAGTVFGEGWVFRVGYVCGVGWMWVEMDVGWGRCGVGECVQ